MKSVEAWRIVSGNYRGLEYWLCNSLWRLQERKNVMVEGLVLVKKVDRCRVDPFLFRVDLWCVFDLIVNTGE